MAASSLSPETYRDFSSPAISCNGDTTAHFCRGDRAAAPTTPQGAVGLQPLPGTQDRMRRKKTSVQRLLAQGLGREMRLSRQCYATVSSTVSEAGPKRHTTLTFAGPWLSLIEDFRDSRMMFGLTPACRPATLLQMYMQHHHQSVNAPPRIDNPLPPPKRYGYLTRSFSRVKLRVGCICGR
jgi:hypothetical protein